MRPQLTEWETRLGLSVLLGCLIHRGGANRVSECARIVAEDWQLVVTHQMSGTERDYGTPWLMLVEDVLTGWDI